MAHTNGTLHQVGDVFYFRLYIPHDLRGHFQRVELRRSLNTKSKQVAKQMVNHWKSKTEGVFTMLRAGLLNKQQVQELVDDYTSFHLEQTHRQERIGRPDNRSHVNTDKGELLVHPRASGDPLSELITEEMQTSGKSSTVASLLDKFLEAVSIELEPDQYDIICDQIARKHIKEIPKIELDRDQGNFTDEYQWREWNPRNKKKHQDIKKVDDTSITISQLVADYVKEHQAVKKWKPNTETQFIQRLSLVTELLGDDKKIKSITREDIFKLLSDLQAIPSNRNKISAYKGKTASEIVALQLPSDQTMSLATVNQYMDLLSSVFKWAVKSQRLDRNVADGIKLKDRRRESELRDIFTTEELQKIYDLFSPAPYSPSTRLRITVDEKWIVLLGLYTGARVEEICSLRRSDVVSLEDIPCLTLLSLDEDEGGSAGKTEASKRTIPIHSKLLELGFLEFVANGDGVLLFTSCEKDSVNKHSGSFVKKFSRLKNKKILQEKELFAL